MARRHKQQHKQRTVSSGQEDYLFETLEPRLLLSADPLAGLVSGGLAVDALDGQLASEHEQLAPPNTHFEAPIYRPADADTAGPTFSPDVPPPVDLGALFQPLDSRSGSAERPEGIGASDGVAVHSESASSREILFVDPRTPDYHQLLAELQDGSDGRAFEVVTLDAHRDGIEQISEILGERSDIDAVHIVSHGTDGRVQLGNTWLTHQNLTAYGEAIQGWGGALAEEADLLFYGCNLAASEDGQSLIQALGDLTGADVAASDDLTGQSSLGGDWDLEYSVGQIEAGVAFSIHAQQNWTGLLAWFDASDGTPLAGASTGADLFVGGAGNDTGISGDNGDDVLYGNAGDDVLSGGNGNDRLVGGAGVDELYGENGDDILMGGPGNDALDGGQGADILIGGSGNDNLFGDKGDDLFLFTGAQNGDVYTVDGDEDNDTIDLSEFGTGNVTLGSGTLTVALGSGESFVVNHVNVETIVLAESAGNHAAQADAGADQAVATSSSVTLDASGSSDPDSDPLTYDWQQIEGTWVTLSDPSAVSPTFTAPASADVLTFAVTVSDGSTSDVDMVQITVGNVLPVNITARETVDNDANGQIDYIKITTDQNLDDDFSGLTMTVTDYALDPVTPYVTNIGAGGANDNLFYIKLVENGSPDTGATPMVAVTGNTSLGDSLGNDISADTKILFTSDRDGDSEIYVMDAAGSNQTQLTDNAASDERAAASPDGSQIAFATDRDGNWEIYVMDADGSNPINLSSDAGEDRYPVWSPDGSQIAFYSLRDGNWEIYKMNADGTNQTRLTNNADSDSYPVWSPDGSQIAFHSDRDGNYEIYVMNADGSGQTNLSNNGADDAAPAWSPDGSQIAFRSDRDGNKEIYVMDADGANQTRLTTNTAIDADPAWSRDGSQIAFNSDRDGNYEIYVMDADGASSTRLTNNAAADFDVAWMAVTSDVAMTATDKAAPVLLSATSPQSTGANLFQAVGQQLDLVFSESLSGTATEPNLEAALTFAAGATDGDNLPAIGTGANPITLVTTAATNDTMRVTFNTNNTANTDLLLVGTHTVQVTTGTNLTDTAGNPANTLPGAVTITGSPNNAPVLDDTGEMVLTDIDEDDTNPAGNRVAIIIASAGGDRITDVDAGAVEGIAVIGVDDTNGQWQYNTGSGWNAFGAVSETNAVLLSPAAGLRFVPNANYTGSAGNLTFRAWDQTSGSNGDTGVDVSSNGGSTAFSSATETATLIVNPVNDVPTGLPAVTGTATEDQVLAADTSGIGDADGLGTFGYQWQRSADGVSWDDIAGATASTYTLGDADVGQQMRVVVSYTDGQGTGESLTSAATAAVANLNDAPSGLPTISGTATEDEILTADTSGIGDADGLGSFGYQWQRSADGVTWSNIAGATAVTYTLGDADVGQQMRVVVTYTDGHGTGESLTSAATAAVANLNDAPTGLPAITGIATEDQVLTADTSGIGDADGLGAFGYQWQHSADGVTWSDIGGATSSTYTQGDADVGQRMRVVVTYTDGHGTGESLTSAATAAVANVNDAPTGLPTISGTATEDEILTADTSGIGDADGLGSFGYQWQRSADGVTWSNIAGATASTYTLDDADVGQQMRVVVTYTDGHGTGESLTSAATAAVANLNDAPAGLPAITGIATEDQVLTADTSGIDDADGLGAFGYQWQHSADGVTWSDIAGATASTYTLDDADVGQQMRVVVSYTDGHGTGESLTSAATAAVANLNDAPTGLPAVTGTLTEDQILTADTSGIGDADGLGAFGYQWQRSADGVTWSDIAGATASTYTLNDADVGQQMRIVVSYTDGHGTGESLTSAATAAVANLNDAPTGLPVITGTATEDQVLTADTSGIGDADGLGAFGYQWQRSSDGVSWNDIAGATASTCTLGDADVGQQMRVVVTYTDGQGTGESLTSAATAAVANLNDAPTGLPAVTGTATEDQVLTADTSGISDADGLGVFGYQWQRSADGVSWNDIAGATASTYTLDDADVGQQMRVIVTYTDGHGTGESLTSAATAAVTNLNDAPSGLPAITGIATEDQTLTADTSGIGDADGLGTFGYRWQRSSDGVSWNDIAGATAVTYTLGDADVGQQMRVIVSYTDGQGTGESLTSAGTAAVTNLNDTPSGAVSIDNTAPAEDDVLTASNTLADADGLGAISYQWQRDGVDIAGATDTTYTTVQADVGAAITVLARYTDGHGTPESIVSAPTAAVTNIDDAPVIEAAGPFSIDEHAAASTAVGDVDANDGDGGATDMGITYSITTNVNPDGDGQAAFSIDPATGVITVNDTGDLDFEGTSALVVTVQVDDGVMQSAADVSISLNDVNDAPVITSGTTASTPENTTAVMTVSATDEDVPGDTLIFSIAGGADQALFGIDPASGQLSFNAMPDFESPADVGSDNVYQVLVQVADGQGGTDAELISVTITDGNEFPVVNDQSFNVDEHAANATVLGAVAATDPDSDNLSFAITAGNTAGIFAIDSASGQITISDNTGLDHEAMAQSTLTVQITDDGAGNLTDTATVTIDINDLNESPAGIGLSNAAVDEHSDTSAGYTVGILSTSDPDSGDTATYTVVGGADAAKFSIGGAGGNELILTDGVLDHGAQGAYRVIVRVTDAGGLTHDETFTITVNPVLTAIPEPSPVPEPPPIPEPEPQPEPETGNVPPADEDGGDGSQEEQAKETAKQAPADSGGPGGGEAAGAEAAQVDTAPAEEGPAALFVADEPGVPGNTPLQATAASVIKAISIRSPILDLVFGGVTEPGALSADVLTFGDPAEVVATEGFLDGLDGLRAEVASEQLFGKTVVGSTIVASTGLSVGYVLWLVRGGVLMSSVLSSMPAWRLVDPLPVLAHTMGRDRKDPDDESLESMVNSGDARD